jgi:hypothetical protein
MIKVEEVKEVEEVEEVKEARLRNPCQRLAKKDHNLAPDILIPITYTRAGTPIFR